MISDDDIKLTCLSQDSLLSYGNGKDLYGYKIKDLTIFDTPISVDNAWKSFYESNLFSFDDTQSLITKKNYIKRPPQSYCYIDGVDVN